MTTDPEELDPELDVELGGDGIDDDEDDADDGGLPDGFVVEGGDEDDADAGDADEDDVDPAAIPAAAAEAPDEPDEFEEELAPVVRVPDEEEEAPTRRAGEFICTSCFLVKRESQLAVRSRKVCRDCA